MTLLEMGLRARNAANALACMGSEEKNAALTAISQALLERSGEILAANREDIALAENAGLSKAMIERLTLTQERLAGIARAILKVRDLPDPVGELTVEGLYFAAGDRQIIKNISFRMPAGQSLAIIGPSAAGKSTLCKLLPNI